MQDLQNGEFDSVWHSTFEREFCGIENNFVGIEVRGYYENETYDEFDSQYHFETPVRNICTCEISHACFDPEVDNLFW